MFTYVDHVDAVGTLFQEAATRMVDALNVHNYEAAKTWQTAADAIKAAWPDLVKKSLEKTDATESK